MAASWRTARALDVLRAEQQGLAPRTVPPGVPASSWGTIGDGDHTSTSDHAAKILWDPRTRVVTALDSPHRPDLGLDQGVITEHLRRSRDPRLKYVIFKRRIFSAAPAAGRAAWEWGPYYGDNPHTEHSHVSLVASAVSDTTTSWGIHMDQATANALRVAFAAPYDDKKGTEISGQSWMAKAVEMPLRRISADLQALADRAPVALSPIDLDVLAQLVAERVDGERLGALHAKLDRMIAALGAVDGK